MRSASLRFASFVAGVFSACTPVGSADTSEAPVGILIEASAGLPALELALSSEPKGLEDGMVQAIASALPQALRSCQARGWASEAARAPMTLVMRPNAGALDAAEPVAANAAPPLQACISSELSRLKLRAPPKLAGLTLRVRAMHAPA